MNCSHLIHAGMLIVLTAFNAQGAEQKLAAAYVEPTNIEHFSLRFKIERAHQNAIVSRGQNDALIRYATYTAGSQNQTPINRTILSGLAYAAASIVATKILTQLTDKQWLKEIFFYDQEVLSKKRELLRITSERAIHEDNIKTLTARVPLVVHDVGLSAKLKELITQEIAQDCEAQKRQEACKKEYNTLKATKLGKK